MLKGILQGNVGTSESLRETLKESLGEIMQ